MATDHNAQARANGNGDPLEKDFSHQNNNGYTNGNNTYHMSDTNMDQGDALRRIRTAGSISISPELFEKIYLSPQTLLRAISERPSVTQHLSLFSVSCSLCLLFRAT